MSNEVIHGKDVVIDVYKIGEYLPFICAEDVSIELNTDLVSVKTRGSGKWREWRGQSLGWTARATGLITYDNPTDVTIWDIIERQINMVLVPIRMVFSAAGGVVKSAYGECMINTGTLNAPSDFAKGVFNAQGSGELILLDGITACDAVLGTLTLQSQTSTTATFAYTGATLATRFDYAIETVGFTPIQFAAGVMWSPALPNGSFTLTILPNGSQKITITPICSNGEKGTPISLTYTKT